MVFKSFANLNKGFTFAELIVTIGIIAIFTVISFPYYNSTRNTLVIERAATKLVQDIRSAQEMAISGKEFGSSFPRGGYGVCLALLTPNVYTIFADVNENRTRDGGEAVEQISFEGGVIMTSFTANGFSYDSFDLMSIPPDPTVFITHLGAGDFQEGDITLSTSDGSKTKHVKINKAGLVWIE